MANHELTTEVVSEPRGNTVVYLGREWDPEFDHMIGAALAVERLASTVLDGA
jgi:hypothetical protein